MKKSESEEATWQYCECGCHGHSLSLGVVSYWVFIHLRGGPKGKPYALYQGHGFSGKDLGSFSSFEEADTAARAHAVSVLETYKEKVHQAEGLLG